MNKGTFLLTLCLAVVMCGTAPSLAHAQTIGQQAQSANGPFDPTSARILSDPLFMPLRGQVYGSSAYRYSTGSFDGYSFAGNQRTSSHSHGNAFAQAFSYGILDNLEVRISDSYASNRSDTTSSSTGNLTRGHSEGFTDPSIGLRYRALDQARYPVALDFHVDYAPSLFDSETPGPNSTGTLGSGRQTVRFGATVGRSIKSFTAAFTATASHLGTRDYESAETDDDFRAHSAWNYDLALNAQTRLTNRISFDLGTGYTFANNMDVSNDTTGASWLHVPADVWRLSTGLNYHFIPNRLVGGLTYTYEDYSNSRNEFALATLNNSTRNHQNNVFGARLEYLF
jgi:hypothetical protein